MSTSIAFDILAKDRASSTFNKIGSSANRSSSTMSKFAKVGKVAFFALAAGAALAGKAMYDMTKAAIADEAQQALLSKALKNTAGATKGQIAATESWISAQGRALGVTDDELRPALARLASATGDVGEAQKLTSLAMDAAAGTQKSLETVSSALMKAQNGNVGALSKLGIATKNAAGETMSFEQVTKKMADTFGGQAATKAATLEGKMGRLKLIFDETKETIGAKLIPILTDLADWFLKDGLPAIQKFYDKAKPLARSIIPALGDAFKTVRDVLKEVAPLAKDVFDAFNKLPDGAKKAILLGAGAGVLAKKSGLLGSKGNALTGSGGGLLGLVSKAKPVPVFVTNPGGLPGKGVPPVVPAGGKPGFFKGIGGKLAGFGALGLGVAGGALTGGAYFSRGMTAESRGRTLVGSPEDDARLAKMGKIATHAKISREAVERLNAAFGLIPPAKATRFEAPGLLPMLDAAREFKRLIDSLDERIAASALNNFGGGLLSGGGGDVHIHGITDLHAARRELTHAKRAAAMGGADFRGR